MSEVVMYEEALLELKEKLDQGLSAEGAVEFLHAQGLTITQSMKALVEVMNVSLNEAKSITARHPVWAQVVKASALLIDELERVAAKK